LIRSKSGQTICNKTAHWGHGKLTGNTLSHTGQNNEKLTLCSN